MLVTQMFSFSPVAHLSQYTLLLGGAEGNRDMRQHHFFQLAKRGCSGHTRSEWRGILSVGFGNHSGGLSVFPIFGNQALLASTFGNPCAVYLCFLFFCWRICVCSALQLPRIQYGSVVSKCRTVFYMTFLCISSFLGFGAHYIFYFFASSIHTAFCTCSVCFLHT